MNRKIETTGCCIYCGQVATVTVLSGAEEEKINREATLLCDCDEAVRARDVMSYIISAKENIDIVLKDKEELAEYLKVGVDQIARGEIDSITVVTGKIKIKVGVTPKGNIKVDFTRTTKVSLES